MKRKVTYRKEYKVKATFLDEQGKTNTYDGIVEIVKWESDYEYGYRMHIYGNGIPPYGKSHDLRKKGFDPDDMLLYVVDIFHNMFNLTGISVYEVK